MIYAQPVPELPEGAEDATCPHCDGCAVELASLFGGSVSECLFRCHDCRSHFHWVKWRSPADAE